MNLKPNKVFAFKFTWVQNQFYTKLSFLNYLYCPIFCLWSRILHPYFIIV